MKKKLLIIVFLFVLRAPSFAYSVWVGTHATPASVLENKDQWGLTASSVQGVNVHLAGTANTSAEWKDIVQTYNAPARSGTMIEFQPAEFSCETFPSRPPLESVLFNKFRSASNNGYTIKYIMFYDVRTSRGTMEYWSTEEVTKMRTWLDNNGHQDVRLVWNARNFGTQSQAWCQSDLVDDILIESAPRLWYENNGRLKELLPWVYETVPEKKIFFQIPLSGVRDPYGPSSAYQQVRLFIRWLGSLMGPGFLSDERIVLLPVTYNTNFTFLPELKNPHEYSNSISSIVLSLIEQREYFEDGVTEAFANSYERPAPSGTTSIPNPVERVENIAIRAVPGGFTVTANASTAQLMVINLQGQVVLRKTGVFTNRFFTMNSTGVYIIQLTQGDQRVIQKYYVAKI